MAHRTTRSLGVGSFGALLPLLAVAGASSVADRRQALNAPPENSESSSNDCVSTTVWQIFRGLGSGIAWTISADGYAIASMTDAEWKWYMVTRPLGSTIAREAAKALAKHSGRNMLGFAGFLCVFSGVSCSMEKKRGKDDLLNPFLGGFSAAMAILWVEIRKPRPLVKTALACGVGAMVLHYFIPMGIVKNEEICNNKIEEIQESK